MRPTVLLCSLYLWICIKDVILICNEALKQYSIQILFQGSIVLFLGVCNPKSWAVYTVLGCFNCWTLQN